MSSMNMIYAVMAAVSLTVFTAGFNMHDAAKDSLPYCKACQAEGMAFGKASWGCADASVNNGCGWILPDESCEDNMHHLFGEAHSNYLEWYGTRVMNVDAYIRDGCQ